MKSKDWRAVVRHTRALSRLMCRSAGLRLHTSVMVTDADFQPLATVKGWVGAWVEKPEVKNSGFLAGPLKMAELLLAPPGNRVLLTPTDHPLSPGWMGGVRRYGTTGSVYLLTACSGWTERCDALWALTLSWAMTQEIRFHHVGFQHASIADMEKAISADEDVYGVQATRPHAEGYLKAFIRVKAPEAPNGVYWREHFFDPDEPVVSLHWDVATASPGNFLAFLSAKLESPITELNIPNGPLGFVGETNKDGRQFSIMARKHWTAVS